MRTTIIMSRLTLYVLFGATFLPGFLSDPFDPRTAYSIGNGVPSEVNNEIVSHEIVPLKIREKRQVSVSIPPSSSPPQVSAPSKTSPIGKQNSIWANKTRNPVTTGQSQSPSSGSDGTNLLRNPGNIFTSNNATEHQTTILPAVEEDDAFINGTLAEIPFSPTDFNKENYTEKEDNFLYYVVQYKPPTAGEDFWIGGNKTKHDMLSQAHRRAATLKPKFDFPFYGHLITNLTIATGGFIYLGDQVHAWLAATQYVAPLMGNFETQTSPNSNVSFLSTSEFFVVEWSEVKLHDSPEIGNFTFQTTLYKNGTIVFAYKNVPIAVNAINDTQHPVKVGLSDAYIRDKSILVLKQKTIYEYHRVDLKDKGFQIVNGSAIIFRLQETCLTFTTCETCTAENGTDFDCAWCPKLNRCSSGWDRQRQDWMLNNCDKENVHVQLPKYCPAGGFTFNYSNPTTSSSRHDDIDSNHDTPNFPDHRQFKPETSQVQKSKTSDSGGTSAGGVIAILFFVIVIFASVGWLAYAYFYPHTTSGQLLIRYRPSQWTRGDRIRYSAASIHM
ncbi:plexin domain-containing protein 1 [Folsomia candida]|uniref:Plexin domain-containing protein 1 n=1 Tax=Folsomia candida TaxID=158441 RepID=A0A226ENZ4_FOLCA|nr:plexin domain-containing protein 1 [Folsomia candida]OXA58296.1 Plexin domain-containing protein 1 [Folsomia candida]